jgi:hypothetical protein
MLHNDIQPKWKEFADVRFNAAAEATAWQALVRRAQSEQ